MLRIALALALVVVAPAAWADGMCPRQAQYSANVAAASAEDNAEAAYTALPEPDAEAAETAAAD